MGKRRQAAALQNGTASSRSTYHNPLIHNASQLKLTHAQTVARTASRCHEQRAHAFTMIELMVALAILALAASVSFMAFTSISRAWQRGTALADDLNHGDFLLDQIAMGLRSAYLGPNLGAQNQSGISYGLLLTDDGDGSQARDTISWVKIGSALVGKESPLAAMPHRVEITVADDDNSEPHAVMRAWCPYLQPEDFDKEKIEPMKLSADVVGLNCRVATNLTENPLQWETNGSTPIISLPPWR